MPAVAITILRIYEPDWPTWVECQLIDRFGKDWRIIEKLPVLEADTPPPEMNIFPRPGAIACEVVANRRDGEGRFVEIDISRPWAVESVEGVTRFELLAEQVSA